MKKIYRSIILLFASSLLPLLFGRAQAQELRPTIRVNTDRLGMEERATFSTLEKQLTEFIGQTHWTNATFSATERIECGFTLNLLKKNDDNTYSAELFVTARRPVFQASYMTQLVAWRDKELNFKYQQYDNLEWNPNNLSSNLVATIAFYSYMIIGLDFDSFGENAGTPYYDMMEQITSSAQSMSEWKGWKPFENNKNRYAIAQALTDSKQEPFRKAWYEYHRKGLDEMVPNGVEIGRKNLFNALILLKKEHKAAPLSPLLTLFSDCKLEELKNILSQTPTAEKNDITKLIKQLFPTADL